MTSPHPLPDAAAGDDRLTELEVKLSFMEDLVERLDTVVSRQEEQIELLVREVARLRHEVAAGDPDTTRTLREELPPHY